MRSVAVILILVCGGVALAQQPITQGQSALTTASLTSNTCPGSGCVAVTTTGYSVATVTIHGTYSGVNITFQFSDDGGTNYYSELCSRTGAAIQESSFTLPSNQVLSWDCGVFGSNKFEVALTTLGSGTAIIGITLSAAPIEPAPTVASIQAGVWNVRLQDSTLANYITSNSTTYTAKSALDQNLLGTLGTAFTTAGKVDVKAAVNDLNVLLPAETTKVIGTVRHLGNAGGIMDTTQNAAVPANALSVGCNFTTSPASVSTGNQGAVQCNSKGELLTQITDGTTNNTLKAASTAAVATDTSLVVEQAPNGGNPCMNPSATLAGVAGATSGTAAVQLIALSGSTKIYVCGATVQGVSGTNPTFSLKYGTGTACATGGVTLIGAFTTTANATFNWPGPAFVTPAGQELCYIQTGTLPISNYNITYVQQ